MPEVRYWYSFSSGTWDIIPCKILDKLPHNQYYIEYEDPEFGTIKKHITSKDYLIFPKFADMVM